MKKFIILISLICFFNPASAYSSWKPGCESKYAYQLKQIRDLEVGNTKYILKKIKELKIGINYNEVRKLRTNKERAQFYSNLLFKIMESGLISDLAHRKSNMNSIDIRFFDLSSFCLKGSERDKYLNAYKEEFKKYSNILDKLYRNLVNIQNFAIKNLKKYTDAL